MSDVVYRYIGGDPMLAHHSSIPAKNLTESDWEALDKEQRATVRASPIYQKVEAPKEAPAKDEPKKAVERP